MGRAGSSSAHMGGMTTDAATSTPMFKHFVPEAEPPVGTVASFHSSFASGGGSGTGYLMRGPSGWSSGPNPQRHEIITWEALTDLDSRNAAIQQRSPGSTAVFIAVEVRIHATPPVDRAGDKARLIKLRHTIYSAAERLDLKTEGVSHIDLVNTIAGLAAKA